MSRLSNLRSLVLPAARCGCVMRATYRTAPACASAIGVQDAHGPGYGVTSYRVWFCFRARPSSVLGRPRATAAELTQALRRSPVHAEGGAMPQQGWSKKRERQYEHIKDGLTDRGRSEDQAEEIAARTVNKE